MPAIIVIATIVLPVVLRFPRCASETKGENVDEIDRASSTPRGHLGAADSPAVVCELRCWINCPIRRYNVYCLPTMRARYLVFGDKGMMAPFMIKTLDQIWSELDRLDWLHLLDHIVVPGIIFNLSRRNLWSTLVRFMDYNGEYL